MKKKLTLILLFLTGKIMASHIAGGEFQLIHLADYQYQINLIIYFDDINGNPGSRDLSIAARIFRNSDNAFIRDVTLLLARETKLEYTQPLCASNFLMTTRLQYSTTQLLEPEIFNDPGGYYIVWERCCRNYGITNIYSGDPPSGQQYAGQTFLLQFPPVIKSGVQFVNSAPILFNPVAEYACTNRLYYTNFSGTDADGDSLVYSITSPLSTHLSDAIPRNGPSPKPYPLVVWRSPFNAQNIMGGNPDIKIDRKGIITVVPSSLQGLFAYAIKCEEYRNGSKIGEVRREFQVLVTNCPADVPPVIEAKSLTGIYAASELTVHFDNTVSDTDRCIKVKVTDNDIFSKPSENIRLKAIPIGFSADVSIVLPPTRTAALSQTQPFAEFSICFDRCPPIESNSFKIGIIAYDDACSVPLADTVKINVSLFPPGDACKKDQSIDFPQIPAKTFGDAPFTLNAVASSGLPLTYSSADVSIASISSSLITLHKPGLAIVTAMQPGNASYRGAPPVQRMFCLNPKPPVIALEYQQGALVLTSDSEVPTRWYRNGIEKGYGGSLQINGLDGTFTARAVAGDCVSDGSNSLLITGAELAWENNFHIFPNPANDFLEIYSPGNIVVKKFILQDIKGHTVAGSMSHDENNRIDIGGLHSGIYVLKIESGNTFLIRKIFKR
jgi:hypothetical protein